MNFFFVELQASYRKSFKMNKNLENICRVCLSSASRNIFEKSTASSDSPQFSIPAIGENVSSLDRLVEKLRYVTMLKVSKKIPLFQCLPYFISLQQRNIKFSYIFLRKVWRFLFNRSIVVAFNNYDTKKKKN